MEKFYTMADLQQSVNFIRQHTDVQPKVAMILGSGLNDLADAVKSPFKLHFDEIPHFPISPFLHFSISPFLHFSNDRPHHRRPYP